MILRVNSFSFCGAKSYKDPAEIEIVDDTQADHNDADMRYCRADHFSHRRNTFPIINNRDTVANVEAVIKNK